MKIVHVTETIVTGVQSYLKSLTAFLNDHAAEGTEVYIIFSGKRDHYNPQAVKEMFAGKATLIEVPMPSAISPLNDAKAARNIYREIKKIQPDVIHLHSSKAGILGRVAAFFYRRKKKVFYTPHGYSFLRKDVGQKQRRLFYLIEKYAQLFLGGTTIACGDTEYELAKKIGRSQLVRNGLSMDVAGPVCPEPDNKTVTVGIVSRITAARDPKLFNTIAMRYPEMNFIWIGDGELRHELTAKNITVTGWLFDTQQLSDYVCSLDVYIQTSLWEGLPYAVLEAMAKRKPVVATNVIGNKDIVVHGETGFLFTNIDELDNYFAVLKNKDTRTQMGQKGYQRCLDVFNNNKNFMELLELYKG